MPTEKRKVAGETVLIDRRNVHLLREYDWRIRTINGYQYVVTSEHGTEIFLQRMIKNAPPKRHVRFKNGDGLDCRETNLVMNYVEEQVNEQASDKASTTEQFLRGESPARR